MNKRPFMMVILCGYIASMFAFQTAEGKKSVIIPNAALIIHSKPLVENPDEKIAPPEVVKLKPDERYAPKVIKQETVFLYENIAAVDYFNLGISLRNEGMYEQAIEAFNKVLTITPHYGDAHYNLALAHLALGNGNAAFQEYQILRGIDAAAAEDLYNDITDSARSDMDNKFIMQVGAFRNNTYAEAMIEKIKTKYLHAYIEKTDRFKKVRICGIKSKEQGERMMLEIGNEFNIKPYLFKLK